jgi:hypothetical protein
LSLGGENNDGIFEIFGRSADGLADGSVFISTLWLLIVDDDVDENGASTTVDQFLFSTSFGVSLNDLTGLSMSKMDLLFDDSEGGVFEA